MRRTNAGSFRRALVSAGVAAVAVLVFLPAAAAAPGNDAFASAQTISGETGSVTGTNVEATLESEEPDHSEDSVASVWYRWTAPTSGPTLFETCGAEFDTVLAAYTGSSLATLTRIAASDDACRNASRITIAAIAGTTYAVAVAGYAGATGPFTLRWRRITAPANDAFAAAQAISGPGGTIDATNIGASTEPGEPRHAGASGASVWFSWTAPRDGVASFDTCGSEIDTVLAVYTGDSLAALTVVASNDNRCGSRSRVRFVARSGTTYKIAVGTARDPGEILLTWTVSQRPSNDDSSHALRLRSGRGSMSTTNAGSLGEASLGHEASVWFRWRPARTMGVTFDTCAGASFDTVISVYRGPSLRRAVRIDENDDACEEVSSRVAFLARRGVNYFIVVDGLGGAWGTFTLNWGPATGSAGRCIVPDVRGITLAQAKRRLERADCVLGRVVRSRSRIVPSGRVIAQYPFPFTAVRLFARVSLEVSRG